MQDAAALLRPDDLLRQKPAVRLVRQLIEAEQALPPAFAAQRHVARRLIQIRLKTSIPDPRLLCEKIGENVEHQLLRLMDIVQIAVNVHRQRVAVLFHQSLQPCVVAGQILPIQCLVAGHPAPSSAFHLSAIQYIRIREETQGGR